jgi:hypothetical protein
MMIPALNLFEKYCLITPETRHDLIDAVEYLKFLGCSIPATENIGSIIGLVVTTSGRVVFYYIGEISILQKYLKEDIAVKIDVSDITTMDMKTRDILMGRLSRSKALIYQAAQVREVLYSLNSIDVTKFTTEHLNSLQAILAEVG